MAQLERGEEKKRRLITTLRQRPMLLVALTLVVGLLAGSALFGVLQAVDAGGIEIERVNLRSDDTADDAEATSKGQREAGESDDKNDEEVSSPQGDVIVVDVAGAVESPSVVQLREGDRVQDAIDAAGGLSSDADVSSVNRAAKLVDGQQVYVPHEGEDISTRASGSASGGASSVTSGSSLVNINLANVEELDTLPGIGPSTAQSIVDDREANGPFASPEDLMRVSGIGEKKFEKLKASICV
ncbi:ComEA family DNA-binding protein [Collinsella provencensis]|uniref:ComEA family DNA-binding protein n=1 Tax=Collinsella provencensis TaxID=1937461 RepID=UPI000C85AF37|nr:ComEA family DNA-binding protein [Collinsella provencensis]